MHLIKKLYVGKHAWNVAIIGNDVWYCNWSNFFTPALIKRCSFVVCTSRPLIILCSADYQAMQKFVCKFCSPSMDQLWTFYQGLADCLHGATYQSDGLDLHSKWWVVATILTNEEKTAKAAKPSDFFGYFRLWRTTEQSLNSMGRMA